MEFEGFAKIARLARPCVITEKIDGTNAQIFIEDDAVTMKVGSRSRWITPEDDNFGFAKWAWDNAEELLKLGPGRHFGEWWGSGIQRGYGLQKGEKRFSLFNTARWSETRPACCDVVPVLYAGGFSTVVADDAIDRLRLYGSSVVPGFMKPEGIVVWHEAARQLFKKTLEKDEAPKGAA